jgi:hypothetical protein
VKTAPSTPLFLLINLLLACACAGWLTPDVSVADTTTATGTQPVYAWTPANIDVDALAARMPIHRELYLQIRDQALAAYAQTHPTAPPYDDDAKKLIKLMTYLWLWGDPYRENLWQIAAQVARRGRNFGATDEPIFTFMADLNTRSSESDYASADLTRHADAFAAGSYPDVFKAWYYQMAISKLNAAKSDPNRSQLPVLIHAWGQIYTRLIQKPLPNVYLFSIGDVVESEVQDDDATLTPVKEEIDHDFVSVAPENPVPQELDGDYFLDEAWLARSSDWANKVTDAQWTEFAKYLTKADDVLEAIYAKHPEESAISVLMIKVELGQGQGRDRMEKWFQSALQADPTNSAAYSSKFWYLQPRWYGSEEDLVNFGQECIDSPNPQPEALTAFVIAISQESDIDHQIYKRPEVWAPIQQAYQLILNQHPQSIFSRTMFAKHAEQGGHWDIAKEQLTLLGDNWDRSAMSGAEHANGLDPSHPAETPAGVVPNPPDTPSTGSSGGSLLLTLVAWFLRFFNL